MGLSYDSDEAKEFIQQAIGEDSGYCQKVYGQVSATYVSSDNGDCEDCDSCQSTSYDQAMAVSVMEYELPVLQY